MIPPAPRATRGSALGVLLTCVPHMTIHGSGIVDCSGSEADIPILILGCVLWGKADIECRFDKENSFASKHALSHRKLDTNNVL